MARKELIKAEALSVKWVPEECSKIDCFRLGFQEGAKWADRTMLDKASEWLKIEISNYVSYDGEIDEDLIIDLRKAMEE